MTRKRCDHYSLTGRRESGVAGKERKRSAEEREEKNLVPPAKVNSRRTGGAARCVELSPHLGKEIRMVELTQVRIGGGRRNRILPREETKRTTKTRRRKLTPQR